MRPEPAAPEPGAAEPVIDEAAERRLDDTARAATLSVTAGVLAGAVGVTLVVLAVSLGRSGVLPALGTPAEAIPDDAGAAAAGSPLFYVLVFGTLAAIGVAALTTMRQLGTIGTVGRRGALGAVSVVGTIIAALVTAPVNHVAGQPGLVAFAALATLGLWRALRARRRSIA